MNSIAVQPNLLQDFDLPWVTKRGDRKRFIGFLIAFLAITTVLGLVFPMLELLRLLRPADSCTSTGMNALLLMHSARLVTSHTDRMSLSS